MSSIFEGLKPSLLWEHFEQILKIPHCSGNEEAFGNYIISVAERLNLGWKKDNVGNVVVEKKASPGNENAEGVILQGHLDMVGEKNSDVAHDFDKDPIEAETKGEWVQAKGTTLGSDNGIGVAASLAIMEDESLVHGPLEFLFTVDEETGLTGATKIGPGFLKGKKLLNLDSEDEGVFTIGCAGGADSEITLPIDRKKGSNGALYRLKLYGFRGGHSGIDINQGRGNAIKLLSRVLWQASKEFSFELISMEGGNKRNAIAREAWADLLLDPAQEQDFSAFIQKAFEKIQFEYKAVEKDAAFSFEKSTEEAGEPLSAESQQKFINLLFTLPHGVLAMHPEMKDLVETSTNMAIIHSHQDRAQIICSSRSSIASAIEATRNTIASLCELAGANVAQPEGYPGWTPDLQSPLLKTLKDVYQKTFQQEPEVGAVHAGLECGIIGEKFPGMDMISFGPTIENPHSPDERVHTGSVEKFWKFLTATLEELK
ncbi:aminoacyl-histidine dipeptidase [candidate division WOR-1 bacterium DG_54_3]|uniref:Cytosol non-specific dipeptidase n=1 Tax=candidate division WOR-1 bacterium DG_54_3 TaxID=1703775 RepID=A0A0S7Y3Y6_UNCSA|nr:MAG: aminoacyl-histidine dipeptidase [candidate division WOR-1 bacterium DG_54_3]